jgi:hypothetical protein
VQRIAVAGHLGGGLSAGIGKKCRLAGANRAKVLSLAHGLILPVVTIVRRGHQGVFFLATRAAIASRSTLLICARKLAQLCLISLAVVKCGEMIGALP